MSKLKAIGYTILSLLVTGHAFGKGGLEIKVLWMFRFHISYDQIIFCDVKVWNNEYEVFSESLKESVYRVLIRTQKDFAVIFRIRDATAFVSRLRQDAPNAQVRNLRDVNRSVTIGRKTK